MVTYICEGALLTVCDSLLEVQLGKKKKKIKKAQTSFHNISIIWTKLMLYSRTQVMNIIVENLIMLDIYKF